MLTPLFAGLQKRINITKTVRKTPIDFDGNWVGRTEHDVHLPEPKYDDFLVSLGSI